MMPRLASIACAVLLLSVFAACGGEEGCDFDAETRDVGGIGLMDCGFARGDDASAVDRCAVTAYRMGITFRAVYERSDGSLDALVHGTGGYALLRTDADGSVIERADCEDAHEVQRDGRSFVECTDSGVFDTVCK